MFAQNIRYLRKEKEMTQEELATRMGYKSFVTISKWETGTSKPRAKELEKLSSIFKVSIDDLMYSNLESGKEDAAGSRSASIRINVYGSVPAGIPTEAIEDIVDWEEIPKEWTSGGRTYFGLKVKGDSMYPKYMDGDTIIIRRQSCCDSGQDCIVYVNGHDATLKKVLKRENHLILQPLNPLYEPKVYEYDDPINPIKIAGVVVEIRRSV